MQLIHLLTMTLCGTLASASPHSARPGCFPHGTEWAGGHKQAAKLAWEFCRALDGKPVLAGRPVAACHNLDAHGWTAHVDFAVGHTGDKAAGIGRKECVKGLEEAVVDCKHGGGYKERDGWWFVADPNKGLCPKKGHHHNNGTHHHHHHHHGHKNSTHAGPETGNHKDLVDSGMSDISARAESNGHDREDMHPEENGQHNEEDEPRRRKHQHEDKENDERLGNHAQKHEHNDKEGKHRGDSSEGGNRKHQQDHQGEDENRSERQGHRGQDHAGQEREHHGRREGKGDRDKQHRKGENQGRRQREGQREGKDGHGHKQEEHRSRKGGEHGDEESSGRTHREGQDGQRGDGKDERRQGESKLIQQRDFEWEDEE